MIEEIYGNRQDISSADFPFSTLREWPDLENSLSIGRMEAVLTINTTFFSCYCIISLILKDWMCAFISRSPKRGKSTLTVEVGFQEKKSVSWLRGDTEPQGKSKSRLVFDLTAVALRLVSLNPHVLTKDCFLNEWGRREQMTSSDLLCSLFRRRGNHTFF